MKWLLKMAWRDARASKARLLLFMSSLILGIAAVVAIQQFSTNLKSNIKTQSKAMMGADYIIDSRQTPTDRAQEIIDSLQPAAYEVNFVSMAAFPKTGDTKLVKVRGLEGPFPFYGAMETIPENAGTFYQDQGAALVDATLMLQFNVKVGDTIKIGKLSLPIAATLESMPGSTAIAASIAPSVIIPQGLVEQTELLQLGSRKEYQYFYKAADTLNLEAFEDKISPMLDLADADLDTHTSTSQRLGRRYENIGKFLNLTAFIALILGCIGIASSVQIYVKEKLASIAILKCLGASRKQSFLIYLIQVAGIGLLGGVIGTALGVGLQFIFPYFLSTFLPFQLDISIEIAPIFIGIFLGLMMSVLFALLPLLATWYVSPLQVLRVDNQSIRSPFWVRLSVFGGIVLVLLGCSFWLLEDVIYALSFVGGTLVTFGILAGIATLTMRLIKRYFPKNLSYTSRQSLLNLFRPNNQTVVLVVAIGLGTFLVSTLFFTKDILLAKTNIESQGESPNIILLDVQSEQRQQVLQLLERNNAPAIDNIPIVTMRMHEINGRNVKAIEQDTTREIRGWVLNHEFRTTYRDQLTAFETINEGTFISKIEVGDAIPISVSQNLAKDAQLNIGDPVSFNVQGLIMETYVGSIREVDWGQLSPNFTILFPAGVLEEAPQFNVITTAVGSSQESAALQRELVAQFSNLTVIDLRQVYNVVTDVLDKISWVINFMAFFSIVTGIIVLIGSVRTSKYQRVKESVLLRTLGAVNRQIVKISSLEYIFLGFIGGFVGVFLALLSSFILAFFVFKEVFTPSWIPFLIFLPAITILVTLIGLSNIKTVLSSSPLEVLRKEV
jgi:putative ABC transport system permease protein